MSPEERSTQADFLKNVPATCQAIFTKAFAKTLSPRAAIKAKCLDCSEFDRDEIRNCTVVLCPLHAYRPFQVKAKP